MITEHHFPTIIYIKDIPNAAQLNQYLEQKIIQWSRQDIFAEPRGQNPVTQNGQPILRVNITNPAQTGMPPITPDELSSITLGSFQPRLVRSYVTHQR